MPLPSHVIEAIHGFAPYDARGGSGPFCSFCACLVVVCLLFTPMFTGQQFLRGSEQLQAWTWEDDLEEMELVWT